MIEFLKIWVTEVKRLAETYVAEPKFIMLLDKGENYMPTQE